MSGRSWNGIRMTVVMSAAAVMAIGSAVMAVWFFQDREFVQVISFASFMKFNSALGFVLCGAALLCRLFNKPAAAAFAALVVLVIALVTLAQYPFGRSFGIDLFFMVPRMLEDQTLPARMTPGTAVCFILASVALMVRGGKSGPVIIERIAGFLVSALALIGVLGYFFGVEFIYRWGHSSEIGLQSAIAFIILGIGLVALSWKRESFYLPIVFVASLGFLLSAYAFIFLSQVQEKGLKAAFFSDAQEITFALEREVQVQVGMISALHAFFNGSEDVTRKEFQIFTETLLRSDRGVYILEWVPRVPAAGLAALEEKARSEGLDGFRVFEMDGGVETPVKPRDEYFPVFYLEHYMKRQVALGLDLASIEEVLPALERARDLGILTASPRMPLLWPAGEEHAGIILFLPLYAHPGEAAENGSAWRREHLEGFITGVFRLEDLIQKILKRQRKTGVNVYLFDDSTSGSTLMYQHRIGAEDPDFRQFPAEIAGPHYIERFEVGGRQWAVLCIPSKSYISAMVAWWIPWGSLAIGLMFTWLLCAYLYNALRYNDALERLNRRLHAEIAERKNTEELRASEERFRGVVSQAVDTLFLIHRFGDFVDANDQACEELGYTREELLGMTLFDVDVELERRGLDALWERLRKESSVTIESTYRRKDGGRFPVEVRLGLIELRQQRFLLALVRDISERRAMEQVVRETNFFLDSLIENMPHMVFVKDAAELRFVRFNREAEDLVGYRREEIIGKNDYDFFPKEEADFFTAKDREVLEKKRLVDIPEEPIHTRYKGIRILHTKKIPILNEKGDPLYLLGMSEDITERIRAEERLREVSLAMENAVEGISRVDENGRYASVNRVYAENLGVTPDELTGQMWIERIFAADREKAQAAYDEMIRTGKGEAEVRTVGREGAITHMYMVMIRVQAKGNRFIGHYNFLKDVTERKYRESLEIKSDMVSMVAHELRTPLHSVREGVSVMLEGLTGDINEEQEDVLTTTKSSLDRLVRLVNSVLDFQRLEAGIIEFRFGRHDINEIVRSVMETTEPSIYAKGLDCRLDLGQGLPQVECDRDRIIQVLTNLVNNAVKFTDKGKIAISTRLENRLVIVSVRDTGIGIREEDISRLFRKFGQLEYGAIMAPGGTGLGLVISKKIMERHGGNLWVESEYGKGSTFSLSLPVFEQMDGLA